MRKLLLIAAIASALVMSSCKQELPAQHTVRYQISSMGAMNVSYTDPNGLTRTVFYVSSSWNYVMSVPADGRTVKLEVESTGGAAVGASIYIDGEQVIKANSEAGSVIVAARVE